MQSRRNSKGPLPRSIACALFITLVMCVAIAETAAEAQQSAKVARLGYLTDRAGPSEFDEAFLRGMREFGYSEGRNLKIEYRWAAGKLDQLPLMASELVSLHVDVIVTSGVPAANAAKQATAVIPIVMATSGDAVADGLVASFAHPGGNITGRSLFTRQLSEKRIEVIREAVPGLVRVAALFNGSNPATPPQFRETQAATDRLGMTAIPMAIRFPEGIDPAFAEAARADAGAVVIISDAATISYRNQLGSAGLKYKLPTIFSNRAYLVGGGLMSYGPNIADAFHDAAGYVDRILNGARPGDLPVEQPQKFELVINFKTAMALGITIPRSLLLRADEVIQ
jgi:putative ABC transport system substrate-binding protein